MSSTQFIAGAEYKILLFAEQDLLSLCSDPILHLYIGPLPYGICSFFFFTFFSKLNLEQRFSLLP